MSFNDIRGQNYIVNILKKTIENSRISQAFLFYGNSGVGKYLAAFNFTKAINCEKNNSDSCDTCISCRKIIDFNHPDVFVINSEADQSSIKIDDIRRLQANMSLKCYESDRKICIIRDAEKMTSQAQNALLKSLEDMSKKNIIILTVSNLADIFPTVTSRCKLIRFNPLGHDILDEIISKESEISDSDKEYVINLSGGSLEKAFEFLNKKFLNQRNKLINLMSREKSKLLFYEPEYESRNDIIRILDFMVSWYRDILLVKNNNNNLVVNQDKIDILTENAKESDLNKIINIIENIIYTKKKILGNANVKLTVENNMIKICELEGVV